MSDFDKSTFTDFGKLVPGFDFLQNLTRQATASAGQGQPKMPHLGHWVAPTMNVEELEKRIAELKAVQFWLDQNATALKATIQALEVQKMTLATLHGMNVNMSEMAKAFSVKMPDSAASPAAPAAPEATEPDTESPARAPGGVDPMQWWGALTQQFQSIAASALKEVSDRQPLDAGKGMPDQAKKTAAKALVRTKAKPKAKAPARAPLAAARKAPSRTR